MILKYMCLWETYTPLRLYHCLRRYYFVFLYEINTEYDNENGNNIQMDIPCCYTMKVHLCW